jgi:Arc/MetJ-type ribon-helix-helix transcriptional regulator
VSDSARISVRVPAGSLEQLDKLAARRGLSRSEAIRALIEEASAATTPASLGEALTLLSGKARAGDVRAQIGLVRALAAREEQPDPVQAEIDELGRRRRAREQQT